MPLEYSPSKNTGAYPYKMDDDMKKEESHASNALRVDIQINPGILVIME